MSRLDASAGPGPETPASGPVGPEPQRPGDPPPPQPDGRGQTSWTVARGESFWVIARRHLTEGRGHAPADAEVARYWTALVEANHGRLRHRRDPNLIYPGQELALPPM